MALNPLAYTECIVQSFLRYQLTAYPFADERLHRQMRELLSLETARRTPLLKGPYVSLSRAFRSGESVQKVIDEGLLHPHMAQIAAFPSLCCSTTAGSISWYSTRPTPSPAHREPSRLA